MRNILAERLSSSKEELLSVEFVKIPKRVQINVKERSSPELLTIYILQKISSDL
jgi:hypothetical protein